MSRDGKRVLCVGLVCLDIVKIVADYPQEDSAQRCLDCAWQRGGNASNTSSVLALLGQPVEYFGTVAQSQELRFLREDFASYGVSLDHVVVCPDMSCPLSVVIVNTRNGSRTILHTNNNLREANADDFMKIDLSTNKYKWIHFECRPNVQETARMLHHVQNHNKTAGLHHILTSVEFEKPSRKGCEQLFALPDYLFLSKEFAQDLGYDNMEDAVVGLSNKTKPGATVICAWGDKGAAAKSSDSDVVISPAVKLEQVVDTLAAGDTFIAGSIFALSGGGVSTAEAIGHGCKVAGMKCGMRGLKGLASLKS
ncbi:ketohexokinase-like [Haliotis rufescens]|uniref:ketohexokinase-like n=1 Tax=Haliotis rufescens TaxID=6454 RepID=UPI00201ED46B|nr:ketohexokinase-like [Haliotis rufescens]